MILKILKSGLLCLVIILGASGTLAGNALGVTGDPGITDQDAGSEQILVKFKAGIHASEIALINSSMGGKVKDIIPSIGVQVVSVPTGKAAEKIKNYKAHPEVLYAENDSLVHTADVPDDTAWSKQWNMGKVQAADAWNTTQGSKNINIAVVDTGIDTTHPDLVNKVIKNINFTTSTTTGDIYGHGTHVAGIAAADTNNAVGVAGLGFNSSIFNVKVLGDNGFGYNSWVAMGIVWAVDNGAQVINLSLGDVEASIAMEDAVNYAWSKGVIVVAAAGNYGNTAPFYPAYGENSVAVAATDINDKLVSWSTRGEWVDVAAPGVSIYSTVKNSGYGYLSGTSMATPHVAGLAALLYSVEIDQNGNGYVNDEVRARLESTADIIGDAGVGSGRINAYEAVYGLQPQPASISGTVTSYIYGLPIAGVTISGAGQTVTTDNNGSYALTGVAAGSYVITATKDEYTLATTTLIINGGESKIANFVLNQEIVPNEMWVDQINFKVRGKTFTISPVIMTANGVVSGVNIEFETILANQNWDYQGSTDSSGAASLVIYKPSYGTYTVTITGLSATNYSWNMSKGVISASYAIIAKGKSRKNLK